MTKPVFLAALMATLPLFAFGAPPGHPYEGAWIWDRSAFVPPPNMPEMTHMTAETMLVMHDDGARYEASFDQLYDNGQRVHDAPYMPEDGAWHALGQPADNSQMSMAVLPDGDRLMQFRGPRGTQRSLCHVTDGGMTMYCHSTYTSPAGVIGDMICVYRRDPHTVPVASVQRVEKIS